MCILCVPTFQSRPLAQQETSKAAKLFNETYFELTFNVFQAGILDYF